MTRKLYSISALSVELGRDRRTIAAALDSVSPDGKIAGGHNGWHLQTALLALGDETHIRDPMSGLLAHYLDRVENWRETTGAERLAWKLDDVAELLGNLPHGADVASGWMSRTGKPATSRRAQPSFWNRQR